MKPSFHQPAPFALLPHAFAAFAAAPATLPADALQLMQTKAETFDEYCADKADRMHGLQVDARTGIAVQPISGVMMAGVGAEYEAFCGYFDTERIVQACGRAAADTSINALVLQVNSPGGYTGGVREAAAALTELRAARPGMPLIAYAERVCASAALWVSMACTERAAAPGAEVGGIGTYMVTADASRYYMMNGIDVRLFADGQFKGLGAAGVAWSDAWYGHIAQRVAKVSEQFKGAVMQAAPAHDPALMEGQSWAAADGPLGSGQIFALTIPRFDSVIAALGAWLQTGEKN